MSLPAELAALRDEAMLISCDAWAIRRRWPLARGIDRAGPCPVCGGKDRFAIHTGKNTFLCRKCGISGLGVIDLVMQVDGVDFKGACEIITGRKASEPLDAARADAVRRQVDADRQRQAKIEERRRADAIEAGRAIVKRAHRLNWDNPKDDGVAGYLRRRGILLGQGEHPHVHGSQIRLGEIDGHPWLEEQTGADGRRTWHTLVACSAMIAAVQLPDGSVGAAHQTWIDLSQPKGRLSLPPDDKGRARPGKKVRGSMRGGAIRVYTPQTPRRIVMGEGIETTLTALAYNFEPATAYWAGVALGNMAGKAARDQAGKVVHDLPDMADRDCFLPPDWCRELVYLCDSDEPETRTEAKITRGLMRAQALREQARATDPALPTLECAFVEPIGDGQDLNDLVRVYL